MEDIDHESFNSEKTFEELLRAKNLKSLVQANLSIQAEIKSIDHDVQSLVFENYSKFISSIEVVKKMREEIDKTEDDLNQLQRSIDNIRGSSRKIDAILRPKRQEIQKLDKINKDLDNLKMLCELPLSLENDLKALKTQDVLSLSSGELHAKKELILANAKQSLADLQLCKDKLLAFHSEALIAPIFRDVVKSLDKLQTFLFLLFNESFAKLPLEVLADLFLKLQRIGAVLEECRRVRPHDVSGPGFGSMDNLVITFFKYFYMNWEKSLRELEKQRNRGLAPGEHNKQRWGNDPTLSLSLDSDLGFGQSVKNILKKGRDRASWKSLQAFMHMTFDTVRRLDDFFVPSNSECPAANHRNQGAGARGARASTGLRRKEPGRRVDDAEAARADHEGPGGQAVSG